MRRIAQLLTFIFCLVVILTISSRWSSRSVSSTVSNHERLVHQPMVFQPADQIGDTLDKAVPRSPTQLAKYVHLDLKGAPPNSQAFYKNFFRFLNKLNLGVRGVLIEYEDTLPLKGRFINVSTYTIEHRRDGLRFLGDASCRLQQRRDRVDSKSCSESTNRCYSIDSNVWTLGMATEIARIRTVSRRSCLTDGHLALPQRYLSSLR
jgi:hypothetical protein